MHDIPVIIIGGGVSGLTCANYLHKKGVGFLLLEASEEFGGRVKTASIDGYLLDRGFQVLQTNYPEAKKLLDYETLNLKTFKSGAKIRKGDGFMTMQNPFRNPLAFIPMAFSSVGSFVDKLKIAKLIGEVKLASSEELISEEATTTYEYLKSYGFSEKIINTFFRPFFAGVFLEEELTTGSNFFRFTFKQFFEGNAAVPENGMQEIPSQLLNNLPASSIRKNVTVESIENNVIKLSDGTSLSAGKIVLATNPEATDKILNLQTERVYNSTTCLYFSADFSPMAGKKYLMLNPNRRQLVHHMCVPSDVSAAYAPAGKTLISVTLRDAKGLSKIKQVEQTKRELNEWFGSSVNAWRLLEHQEIPQAVSFYDGTTKSTDYQVAENIYRCGDYLAYPSLNAAMKTGREVAELVAG
ncbi:MAG: protoporphyrinogen oxidase [Spirosomataceae bacterium]|jgi:protoporphyrinogen oxidase